MVGILCCVTFSDYHNTDNRWGQSPVLKTDVVVYFDHQHCNGLFIINCSQFEVYKNIVSPWEKNVWAFALVCSIYMNKAPNVHF